MTAKDKPIKNYILNQKQYSELTPLSLLEYLKDINVTAFNRYYQNKLTKEELCLVMDTIGMPENLCKKITMEDNFTILFNTIRKLETDIEDSEEDKSIPLTSTQKKQLSKFIEELSKHITTDSI